MRTIGTRITDRMAIRASSRLDIWSPSLVGMTVSLGFACLLGTNCQAGDAVEPSAGAQIYRQLCIRCHGDVGQGDEEGTVDPLRGDRSVEELATMIAETMPDDDPQQCVGEAANQVAAHIHQAFYGPAAQNRRNPPRRRLARLTAEQLRQSIADLYAHFGQPPPTTQQPPISQQRGISARYYTGGGPNDDRLRIARIDPTVDFDFGIAGPGEEVDPEVFHIRWSGALLAPQSGSYEIVVRSSCSFKMQFGQLGPLFFDNHVQSAGKEEFRRIIRLTGGRVYPLKIELQQRKRKTEQPPVRISLAWVPPGGSEEIIPTSYLFPESYPSSFALQSKLAPDDRSYGYERGIAIDRSWDHSVTDAAVEFADVLVADLYPALLRQADNGQPPEERLRSFLIEMLAVAFRGPANDPWTANYVDQILKTNGPNHNEAIRHAILKAFKSPRFLYPTIDHDRSRSQQIANRLTLVLFDSLPSESWMLEWIEEGQLQTNSEAESAAERMVDDFRALAKIRSFLYHWLDLSEREPTHKDQDRFPNFDARLVNDLNASFNHLLDGIVHSERSDFRELFQADAAPTNRRIADFYGDAWSPRGPDAALERTMSDSPNRFTDSVRDPKIHVGVLTHPWLTSHFAYHQSTSPIHRGVFLTRDVLGRVIRPPAEAFTPFDAELHPDLTTRQRTELQTGSKNCQVCHRRINGLGFALEHFDAVGRYRDFQGDRPIDASGSYQPQMGPPVQFDGARQLGDYLANSDECQRAFVDSAFEYFVKQPIAAYGPNASDRLLKSFRENDFHIRKLIVQIATLAADDRHLQQDPSADDQASDR